MMQASIAMATTRFSSDRMVREYFERLYTDGGAEVPPEPKGRVGVAPRTAT